MNQQRDPLNDSDIRQAVDTVWRTLDHHRRSRSGHWPVQPVVYTGFQQVPDGLFGQKPASVLPHR